MMMIYSAHRLELGRNSLGDDPWPMLVVLMRVNSSLLLADSCGILWLLRSSQPLQINVNQVKNPTLNNLLKYTMVNKE